jgi:hypothetical protein
MRPTVPRPDATFPICSNRMASPVDGLAHKHQVLGCDRHCFHLLRREGRSERRLDRFLFSQLHGVADHARLEHSDVGPDAVPEQTRERARRDILDHVGQGASGGEQSRFPVLVSVDDGCVSL